ncbi:MAG: class I SAM-dependent methyltransferase [Betaproteobacteria bacterium]|nr:class I SAM-dependent methyltransferase [Betaproteobacteria bacterium]
MARPGMLPVLLRETWAERTLPREPEPDLVMEGPEQVAAFVEAGRIDGVMAASYLFNTARITQAIRGCRTVVDLGCGPATQLAQVAQFNPDISFTGVDLSAGMLDSARSHVDALGLNNVRFVQDDFSSLEHIPDHSADGVISTLALHHLPTHGHLDHCFHQITRILRPGGALYLVDLGRLKSLKSVLYFAYMNAAHQPHIFSLDYERSLRAAFLREDFERLSRQYLAPDVRVYTTFKIPVLHIVKTPDRVLSPETQARFREMRRLLPGKYRGDLDDIRLFMRLGGLKDDPFSA